MYGSKEAIKLWNKARRCTKASLDITIPAAERPNLNSLDTLPEEAWVAFQGVRDVPPEMPGQGYIFPVNYRDFSPRMPMVDCHSEVRPIAPSLLPPKPDFSPIPQDADEDLAQGMIIDLPHHEELSQESVSKRKRSPEGESSSTNSLDRDEHKPTVKRARVA